MSRTAPGFAGCLLALCESLGLAMVTGDAIAGRAPDAAATALELAKQQLALPRGTTTVELQMRGTSYAGEQAREATAAFAEVDKEQSVVLSGDGRFRLRTHTRFPGAIVFEFLTVGSAKGSSTIDELQWRNGIEITYNNAASAREGYADLLFLSPALLLRDALAGKPLSKDGPVSAETGKPKRVELSFKDGAGRPATLTLDATTGRVEAATSGTRRYVYVGYQKREGLLQPTRVTEFDGEAVFVRWNEMNARATAAPAADAFDLPSGYIEATDRGPLRATDLGDGTYRIDGAPSDYHTGFVVGDRAIAIFDAPISVEEAEQIKAMIEKTAPGRRIAYVVVSHPHGDHVAGLRAYLKDGAEIVTGPGAGVALRRQLGPKTSIEPVEVAKTHEIDLGGRTVKLYALASTHASSMLVGYAPASRTVFQGDLFYLPEVGPTTPTFEGATELAALIANEGLYVDRIVGVHGRTGTAQDLEQSLELRKNPRVKCACAERDFRMHSHDDRRDSQALRNVTESVMQGLNKSDTSTAGSSSPLSHCARQERARTQSGP